MEDFKEVEDTTSTEELDTDIVEDVVEEPVAPVEEVVPVEEPVVVEKPIVEEKPKTAGYKSEKTVPVYSTKNLFKYNLGEVKIGYNILTEEEATEWLKHKAVRSATAEEIAKEYGR